MNHTLISRHNDFVKLDRKKILELYTEFCHSEGYTGNLFSRQVDLVLIRQSFFYVLKHNGYILVEIGLAFKNKHHSTIMHGISRIKNFISIEDLEAIECVNSVAKMLSKYGHKNPLTENK